MSGAYTGATLREAVGVFDRPEDLQDAIDELLSHGFDRACLSLLAADRAVDEKLSPLYRKVADLEDAEDAPRTAYVAPESFGDAEGALVGGLVYVGAVAAAGAIVASGGALASVVIGAALAGGAGGMIGSVLARLVGRHHAQYLQRQIERGGLLLWVRVPDAEHEERATTVLRNHSGRDVHIHDLPADS